MNQEKEKLAKARAGNLPGKIMPVGATAFTKCVNASPSHAHRILRAKQVKRLLRPYISLS